MDVTRTFYLLPIVDFQTVEIEGDEARYLQIAAAVPRERGADTLGDPEYREQAQQSGSISGDAAKALGIDLVFVMDMTRSMQPFIDRTIQTLAELARTVASKNIKQKCALVWWVTGITPPRSRPWSSRPKTSRRTCWK